MKTESIVRIAARVLGAALIWGAVASPSTSTAEEQATVGRTLAKTLQMGVGKSVIIDLPDDAAEIFVADPKVAAAIVRTARRLYVTGVGKGQTSIFALASGGRQIAVIEVSIGRDVAQLKQLLDAAIPNNDIRLRTIGDTIILNGSVAGAGEAQRAIDLATGFVQEATSGAGGAAAAASPSVGSHDPRIVNSLLIRGLDQVTLKVTISEVRREIIKQLGINLSGTGTAGNFAVNNPFSINGQVAQNTASLNWGVLGGNMSATLSALERQNVLRTLAEPTLTAVSGENAKFLAGGTVPLLTAYACSNGVCAPSVSQQSYGVSLSFTPVVFGQGRIQLRIATEVTDVDASKNVTVSGVSVPGFTTRKNETTVELPSGGSIATAGLISNQSQQSVGGVPGLMNIPVLGALFRSRDFLRSESELLIIVTPYIVHKLEPDQVTKVDENFHEASDPQAWLLGRVNRIYSSSGGLVRRPIYSGKFGFITD